MRKEGTQRPDKFAAVARNLLSQAGIEINGNRPWDIQVNNEKLYRRVLTQGSVGLGEAYVEGWWDCLRLDELFHRVLGSRFHEKVRLNLALVYHHLLARVANRQSKARAFQIGEQHYDIDDDLFQRMYGERIAASCAYWKDALTLDEAQEAKLDLVCRKLGLTENQRVLDTGCGWGSFMKYAAEHYGVQCTGITVSRNQIELGQKLCSGFPIEFMLMDYRNLTGQFDHVVSIGMLEHVGYKNYRTYMEKLHQVLDDDGLVLLQTIGGNQSAKVGDPWLNKYIFPNGMLPSIKQIGESIEGLFIVEDWHNFGADYDKTLLAWFENFNAHWPELRSRYDETFYRMWKYYLLSCAGSFRARNIQLWQIVLSKKGNPGGYNSIR